MMLTLCAVAVERLDGRKDVGDVVWPTDPDLSV